MGSIVGGLGTRARVILVLRECISNEPAVSIVLSAFGFSSASGGLSPWFHGFTQGDCLPFLCGE